MPKKIVIDSSSLINLVKYYSKIIGFDKLKELLNIKMQAGELIIIDKVKLELESYQGNNSAINYYEEILPVNTEFLLPNISKTEEWFSNRRRYFEGRPDIMERLKREFQESADPYLILYCLHLKEQGEDVILITEEGFGADGKLYKKIPQICQSEGIVCGKVVDLLFNEYSGEIKIGVIEE